MLKIVTYLLISILFTFPVMANPVPADNTSLTQTIWKAQTMDGLNDGVWVIPETALNDYFTNSFTNDKVKNPQLKLLNDNKMYITFDSSMGKVALTCEIKQFVHNQTESYVEVDIRDKKLADKPLLSWMLKFVSLGAIADLYGNPLKDVKEVDAKFSGNTLKVNFRPLVEKTLLSSEMGRKIDINSITTREGMLELHTNLKPADILGLFMG
ncbi:hypothetical protein [Pelosinus sp. sgz500959]|uniref:hypothetical protein n=1 Tax=Pelosinus sp. sgz500959 TaxID=3242472 RepID=UPI003672C6FC